MEENNADDLLWRINELYEMYSGEASFWGKIANKITDEFGEEYSKDRVRGLWRRSPYNNQSSAIKSDSSCAEDEAVITYTADAPMSVVEFVEKRGGNLDEFFIDRYLLNTWNDQVKVWLKRKTPDEFNPDEFVKRITQVIEAHRSDPPQSETPPFRPNQKEYLFIPVLFDAHIDSPKFHGDYIEWLKKLMSVGIGSGYRPTQILFVVGNDFGHIDNQRYETTNGTLVGSSRTYLDSVDERCSIILKACDLLRSYTPQLDVLFVPGNHDSFSNYWLGKVVESYYKSDLNISVLNGQSPRKYYRYGKNLFGLTHGNEEKSMDLAGLMAVEAPLDWAASENRIWLTGHLHQQARMYNMLNERFGVIKRIFPSLVASDDWHILKGYIGNARAGELLVYSFDGKEAEFQVTI